MQEKFVAFARQGRLETAMRDTRQQIQSSSPTSHDSLMLQDDIDENEETMREAGSFHVLATL